MGNFGRKSPRHRPNRSFSLVAPHACLVFLTFLIEVQVFRSGRIPCPPSFSNIQIIGARILNVAFADARFRNVSLDLNYEEHFFCTERDGFLSFTANRKWHSGKYSVLCVLAIFYPPEQILKRFDMAYNLLRRLALTFSLCICELSFLIMAIDVDVLPLVRRHSAFTEMPCLSSPDICSTFRNLDFGYQVFQGRFNSTISPGGVNLTVLVTSVTQSHWNKTWLRQTHETGVGNYPFSGYYAAAFAYLVTLPYRLRLFDYFDFFSRLDLDAPFRSDTPSARGDFFPVRKMVKQRAYLFGCFQRLDSYRVSTNVANMTKAFLETLTGECGKPLHSHSIVAGFLHSGQQCVPGIFQLFWLGYFSSPELRKYTSAWFTYPEGYQKHRWGDQQYYFRAHALFAINASKTIIYDVNVAGCTFYRGSHSAPKLNISRNL
jgi:hypothetical protein